MQYEHRPNSSQLGACSDVAREFEIDIHGADIRGNKRTGAEAPHDDCRPRKPMGLSDLGHRRLDASNAAVKLPILTSTRFPEAFQYSQCPDGARILPV